MAEQLFQIGIKGLVRNDKGEILMVHVPGWSGNPAHWDLPGGRMEPGETFLETLKRELQEELSVTYVGTPRQLMAVLTKITIPVDGIRLPLVLVVYEAGLPDGAVITLDPDSNEDAYQWFSPTEAASHMAVKFSSDFCELVRNL